VPAVVLRGPKDDMHIHPIIDTSLRDYTPTGDEARDVHDLMRAIMASMERVIRQYPEQWFIFRRMWANPAHAVAAAGQFAEGM
jgi:lauroyl/myristoyl acyltransferase